MKSLPPPWLRMRKVEYFQEAAAAKQCALFSVIDSTDDIKVNGIFES